MNPMFKEHLAETIRDFGFQIIAVGGDADTETPTFSYTIGLTPRFGFELFMSGVPMQHAHKILNDIAAGFTPDMLDKPVDGFANLPLLLKKCDADLDRLHDEFVVQADNFYGERVEVVQVVLSDREGRTPLDASYDHAYMSRFQPLFVSFDTPVVQ